MLKIRPTTELMLMSIIGLMTTLYESSTQSMNDNIREVWASQFHAGTAIGMESIRKSVMTAIALARGLTLHVYIAAYALTFYPFLFERGIKLLLLWMVICAVRSVVVNMAALLTGCIICSYYTDIKPVCFEFIATKAIEIACSVYMWLSVNDFYIRLISRRRSIVASRMIGKTTQISESDLSLLSSDMTAASYMDFDEDIEGSSEDSVIVKAAVDGLMRMAFGVKYENRPVEVLDAVRAQRFLNMSAEELKELQNRIKDKLYKDIGMDVGEQSSVREGGESGSAELLPSGSSAGHLPVAPIEEQKNIGKLSRNESELNRDDTLHEKLSTRSTGSQTKEPSRKLQEWLSKEGMSPQGSKTVEPTRKPSGETGSKRLSASRDTGIPIPVSLPSQSKMSKSNSNIESNKPKNEQPSEERLKVGSTSEDNAQGNVQGILRNNPENENRDAVDRDNMIKKNVSIKKKQL